jgi:DNA-binding transcriptional MerR regulator
MNRIVDTKSRINRKEGSYYFEMDLPILDKKCPLSLEIDRFPLFDETSFFQKYFSSGEEFKQMRITLNEKKYAVGDIGISSRVLNHWASKRLLPEGITLIEGNWKRFSVIEFIWLKAIDRMREYGLPLSKIAKIKSWIMQFDKKDGVYPWFEYYCASALNTEDDPFIIILSDGTAELCTSEDIEYLKYYSHGISNHLLLISLKKIIKDIKGFDVKPMKIMRKLTKVEEKTRSILLANDKEMRINIHKDKDVDIETKDSIEGDIDLYELVRNLRKPGTYGNVSINISDGKIQSTQIKNKKRIEN